MVGEQEKCRTAGMDGYVAKPISPQALIKEIERCLAAAGASPAPQQANPVVTAEAADVPQAAAAAPPEAPGLSNAPPIDLSEFVGRCMDDHEFAAKILRTFEQAAPAQLQSLREAVAAADAKAAATGAHAIKGMAANLAAAALRRSALELEQSSRQGRWDQVSPQLGLVVEEMRRCLECVPGLLSALAVRATTEQSKGHPLEAKGAGDAAV
jgi:HPt (histidine-containing phosphotransfer) domain-containing protein